MKLQDFALPHPLLKKKGVFQRSLWKDVFPQVVRREFTEKCGKRGYRE
jgi:hypothetical protein